MASKRNRCTQCKELREICNIIYVLWKWQLKITLRIFFNRLYIFKIILMKRHRLLLDTRVWKCLKNHAGNLENTYRHTCAQSCSVSRYERTSDLIKVQWDPWTAGRSVRTLTDAFCEAGLSILWTIKQSLALKSEQTENDRKWCHEVWNRLQWLEFWTTPFSRWQSSGNYVTYLCWGFEHIWSALMADNVIKSETGQRKTKCGLVFTNSLQVEVFLSGSALLSESWNRQGWMKSDPRW